MKPLDGMTVVEFAHAAAGPLCTMLLADFGARVIKIEKPGRGDGARYMSATKDFSDPMIGGDYFLGMNRNKESVALDISDPDGNRIARELVAGADVVVENFRPGVMTRLGLDYEQMSKDHPGLIYCDISAFGTTGELANQAGMDVVAQARAGVIDITGEADGPPVRPGISLADMSCGQQAAIGILLAVIARRETGRGQRIELSLLDSTMLTMSNFAVALLNTDVEIKRSGTGHPQLAPYQAYETSDGWVFMGCGTNKLWRALCTALSLDFDPADPRFASNEARAAHKPELNEQLVPIFKTQTTEWWLAKLAEIGVPGSPIVSPKVAFATAHREGRDIIESVDHAVYGKLLVPGISIRMDDTPGKVYAPPPALGEHTRSVLSELLSMTAGQLDDLTERSVIAQYEFA